MTQPSLLGNPYIAQANTMLSNIKQDNQQSSESSTGQVDIKEPELNKPSSEDKPTVSLFPQTDQELNTNILTNFNDLITTLNTPPSNRAVSRIPKTDQVETNQSQSSGGESNKSTQNENISKIKPLMSEDLLSMPPFGGGNPGNNNPMFNMPGVGLANPFLATFIEQQIRSHLQTMQQMNLFNAACQLQSQQPHGTM